MFFYNAIDNYANRVIEGRAEECVTTRFDNGTTFYTTVIHLLMTEE